MEEGRGCCSACFHGAVAAQPWSSLGVPPAVPLTLAEPASWSPLETPTKAGQAAPRAQTPASRALLRGLSVSSGPPPSCCVCTFLPLVLFPLGPWLLAAPSVMPCCSLLAPPPSRHLGTAAQAPTHHHWLPPTPPPPPQSSVLKVQGLRQPLLCSWAVTGALDQAPWKAIACAPQPTRWLVDGDWAAGVKGKPPPPTPSVWEQVLGREQGTGLCVGSEGRETQDCSTGREGRSMKPAEEGGDASISVHQCWKCPVSAPCPVPPFQVTVFGTCLHLSPSRGHWPCGGAQLSSSWPSQCTLQEGVLGIHQVSTCPSPAHLVIPDPKANQFPKVHSSPLPLRSLLALFSMSILSYVDVIFFPIIILFEGQSYRERKREAGGEGQRRRETDRQTDTEGHFHLLVHSPDGSTARAVLI
ncbi:proline-rich protein 36-like [Lepus europaeus]|uniref:proline-rich protein 36-like n=1 Tax=Lepus europaeus TaxID=9983 RepID=UPI002B4A5FC8|nr:proline-rich protein 36-like [Lepus europaeus]XP_062067895.1 proline-rich protein 36-like [Lepus europaeus]XP_062067896.1 proline-rich protein 36-like [Lepus europaeus]